MFGKKSDLTPDLEMFTIYDSKTRSYDRPFFAINREDVVRELSNLMRDPTQKSNKLMINAEDYSVYKIGEYFKASGQITGHNLEHVVNLHDLRSLAQAAGPTSLGIVGT